MKEELSAFLPKGTTEDALKRKMTVVLCDCPSFSCSRGIGVTELDKLLAAQHNLAIISDQCESDKRPRGTVAIKRDGYMLFKPITDFKPASGKKQ